MWPGKVSKGSYHAGMEQKENMVLELIWNDLQVHRKEKGKKWVLKVALCA